MSTTCILNISFRKKICQLNVVLIKYLKLLKNSLVKPFWLRCNLLYIYDHSLHISICCNAIKKKTKIIRLEEWSKSSFKYLEWTKWILSLICILKIKVTYRLMNNYHQPKICSKDYITDMYHSLILLKYNANAIKG